MTKPILVIRVHYATPHGQRIKFQDGVSQMCPDYRVIVLPSNKDPEPQFEVYSVQDVDAKSFQEFKKELKNELDRIKTEID